MQDEKDYMQLEDPVDVVVHRKTTTLDLVFVHVVVLLVILAFVNMGCAIELPVIKENLNRPVALGIGIASQYFFMPLVSSRNEYKFLIKILNYFLFELPMKSEISK